MNLEIHRRYQRAMRFAYPAVFLIALLLSVVSYSVNRYELIKHHSAGIDDYANSAGESIASLSKALQGIGESVRDQMTQSILFNDQNLLAQFRQDYLNELYSQRAGNRLGRAFGAGEIMGREPLFYQDLMIAHQLDAVFSQFQISHPAAGVMYYTSFRDFIKLFPWQDDFHLPLEDVLQDVKEDKLADGETRWSKPQLSVVMDKLVVRLSHGVTTGNKGTSTLSMELPLDSLVQKLKAQQALSGAAIVIDEASGYVLAHERPVKQSDDILYGWRSGLPESLTNLNIADLKQMREGQIVNGYHVQTHSITTTPWILVYVTDMDELLASARLAFAVNLLMLLLALSSIVAILNRAMSSTFLQPATQLANQIRRYAETQAINPGPYPKGWENLFQWVHDTFSEKRHRLEAKERQNKNLDQLTDDRTSQLQQSEMRTKIILEATADGLFDYHVGESTFFTSDRFWTMIGYQPGEYPAEIKKTFELLHPEHRSQVEKAFINFSLGRGKLSKQLQKTGFFQLEYMLRTKQGGYRWIRARGRVAEKSDKGLPLRVVGIHSDVTHAKRAEEFRRRQMQIIHASPDLIASFDQDGFFEYVNKAFGSLCSIEPGQEQLHHIGEMLDSQVIESEVLPGALQYGYVNCEMELKIDHQTLPVSLTLVSHKQRENSRLRYSFIARDVSEQKAFENALLKSQQEAELASQHKSEFLAGMSHEIRTPMHAVLGMLRLVNATELTEGQRDYLNKANCAAKRLVNIIDGALDFSKIEAGKFELENTPFNLEEVVELAISHVAIKAEQKGLLVLAWIDPQVPELLQGDPMRLGQVLSNLLSNAVKFTEQGKVVLTVELVSQQSDEVRLSLSVEDTGIGMDALQQQNLFDAFSQSDTSITKQYAGTGLGLSICHHLIDQMQGEITVESSVDEGSCFNIDLTLTEYTEQQALNCDALGGEALLILKSPERSELLRAQLEHLGVTVQEAKPDANLNQLFDQHSFRYLILDSNLLPDYQSQMIDAKSGKKLEYALAILGYDEESILLGEQHAAALDGLLTQPVLMHRLAKKLVALEKKNIQEESEYNEIFSGERSILKLSEDDLQSELAQVLDEPENSDVCESGLVDEIADLQIPEQTKSLHEHLNALKRAAENLGARKLWALCQTWQESPSQDLLDAIGTELTDIQHAITIMQSERYQEKVISDELISGLPPSANEVGAVLMELDSKDNVSYAERSVPASSGLAREMSGSFEDMSFGSELMSMNAFLKSIDLSSVQTQPEDEDERS